MSNPFATAEAWEVSLDSILPAGNHVVKIEEATNGTSSGQHPQIELRFKNAQGSIRDWLVITQATVGKVVALAQAAGVSLPTDADTDGLRLSDEYVYRFVGKEVGIVVRDEQDRNDPTKTRQRVQGYVDPQRVREHGGSDVTSATAGGSFNGGTSKKSADDIPF